MDAGNKPVLILVLGIVGVTACALTAPFAWMMGQEYERDCRRAGVEPESLAVVGRILGMVGTILLVLSLAFLVVWFVFFFVMAAGS